MPLNEGLRANLEKGKGVSALRSTHQVPECCLDIMWKGLQRVRALVIERIDDPDELDTLIKLANSYARTLLRIALGETPPTFLSLKNTRNNLLQEVETKRVPGKPGRWKEGIISRPLEKDIRNIIRECGEDCIRVMKEDPDRHSILKQALSSTNFDFLGLIEPFISNDPNS